MKASPGNNMECFILLLALPLVFGSSHTSLGELPTDRPLIIAHRGSSGQLPEHTVEAYQLAVRQGADVIECDLAVTKDRQLICSHEPMLSHTTDVQSRPEFADRLKTYQLPATGENYTDFFTIDFTLAELKTLRKIQQLDFRDQSYNGRFAMASLEECIDVAQNSSNSKTVGIYPETKVPVLFNQFLAAHNTTMEDILLEVLKRRGYASETSPCFIQSFDIRSLQYMQNLTNLRLVYLSNGGVSDSLMESMSSYISGLGPWKNAIVTVDQTTNLIINRTNFMERAHSYGYKVHPYTFRNEHQYLAYDYGVDPYKEYELFIDLGVDGMFTDFPASMFNYLDLKTAEEPECPTSGSGSIGKNTLPSCTLVFMVARQFFM